MPRLHKLIFRTALCAGALYPFSILAQQGQITVDATKILNRIPSQLYGACIEDVNHEIYGGLYDQRIFGESFEEPAPGASYSNWTAYEGSWQAAAGGVKVAGGPGYKLVYDKTLGKDYSVSVQLKFGKANVNAGLILNVNKARNGADNFDGYEISLDPNRQMLVLGKHLNNWVPLTEVNVKFNPNEFTTLKVSVHDGEITVYLNNSAQPDLQFTDSQVLAAGNAGLRVYQVDAEFKNFSITEGKTQIMAPFIAQSKPQVSGMWDAVNTSGNTIYALDTNGVLNGKQSQIVIHNGGKGLAGVANLSLNRWGIAVRKGQKFTGSIYLKTEGKPLPLTIALQSADGSKIYATGIITATGSDWKEYTFNLTASQTDNKARFAIYLNKKGKVWLDQATLFTTGKDQFNGLPLRADIAKKMQEQGLNFLRYGGTMVNSPEYRFKKMIGDRARRPPYKGHWYTYSTNGFGIEDFLQFCEAAGFEAAFAINIEETPQDAADMVEYLKGDVNTTWGKKRAKNGHPAPYKVKYIEIGNEEILFNGDVTAEYDHYIERFSLLYDAMHQKDTSLNFVISAWWRPESPNTERAFKALNGKAAFWDLHTDADDPRAGTKVDSTLTKMRALFTQWDPNTKMKCAIFEENGGHHDLARALGHSTTLNAVRRHGDFVLTSCAANALQPMGQNDNGWDQGQIFFTPSQVWGMPPFYAQQMASGSYQPLLISSAATKGLDVTATKSQAGDFIVLHVINPADTLQATRIAFNGLNASDKQVIINQLKGNLNAVNSAAQPEQIKPVTTETHFSGNSLNYQFPAHSYTIIIIKNK